MNYLLIPARYGSTRFPGKPLAEIAGVPLVVRTFERCKQARGFDGVLVLTDDKRIIDALPLGCALLAGPEAVNGTERCAYFADECRIDLSDMVVNVQGDEPLMDPCIPQRILFNMHLKTDFVWTAVRPLRDGDMESRDVVKVRESNGFLSGFSREGKSYHNAAHIGIYGYTARQLKWYLKQGVSPAEDEQGLEQLRWNMPLAAIVTDYDGIGVDRPEHIALVEARLNV